MLLPLIAALSPIILLTLKCITVIVITWKDRGRIASLDYSSKGLKIRFNKDKSKNTSE